MDRTAITADAIRYFGFLFGGGFSGPILVFDGRFFDPARYLARRRLDLVGSAASRILDLRGRLRQTAVRCVLRGVAASAAGVRRAGRGLSFI